MHSRTNLLPRDESTRPVRVPAHPCDGLGCWTCAIEGARRTGVVCGGGAVADHQAEGESEQGAPGAFDLRYNALGGRR